MTYATVTCNKTATVNLRACLHPPFMTQHAYIAQRGWNASQIKYTGTNPIGYTIAGYVNYLNDGTRLTSRTYQESLFTDLATPDQAQWGGYYTGSKLMAVALNGGNYSVGIVSHVVTDPTNTSAASMTITNVGNAGTTPPASYTLSDGPFQRNLCGPSAAGGDRISWFEGRTTTVHFLTSDGTTLTREQAFPLTSPEVFNDFAGKSARWIYDGSDFWLLGGNYTATDPEVLILTRWVPTVVDASYDYDKWQVVFDDSHLNGLLHNGAEVLGVTDDTFFLQLTDTSAFGHVKWLEVAKDGTSYTEYVVTGNDTVKSLILSNLYYPQKLADGTLRLVTTAYSGDGPAVGTYDLTCFGQGHVFAQKLRRSISHSSDIDNRLLATDSDLLAWGDDDNDDLLWKDET